MCADRKSILAKGEFSRCNSLALTIPASSRLSSRNRRSSLRKKTLAAVGVFGSVRSRRSITGIRCAGRIFRARVNHAARESAT